MATVIGYLKDAQENPLSATLLFKPLSTPLALAGGNVIVSNWIPVQTNSLGYFSTLLEPGDYQVQYGCSPLVAFTIAVPDTSLTYDIDTLVTSSLVYTYIVPPNRLIVAATGVVTLALGVTAGTVSGLALGFTPQVVYPIMMSTDNTFIGVSINGTPTSDGFGYVLTSPTDANNKTLGYIAVPAVV